MKDSGKNSAPGWKKFDDVVASLCNAYGVFSPIQNELPDAGFRYFNEKIARQPMRYSGRTAMNAKIAVSEPGPSDDPDSPLNFSMEGYKGNPPSAPDSQLLGPGF